MELPRVVILQRDAKVANVLRSLLSKQFTVRDLDGTLKETHEVVAKTRAGVVVLDMEMTSRADVERLTKEFPGTAVICTHRLADEEMWADLVQAGASDVCSSADAQGILTAILRSARAAQSVAA